MVCSTYQRMLLRKRLVGLIEALHEVRLQLTVFGLDNGFHLRRTLVLLIGLRLYDDMYTSSLTADLALDTSMSQPMADDMYTDESKYSS